VQKSGIFWGKKGDFGAMKKILNRFLGRQTQSKMVILFWEGYTIDGSDEFG